MDSSPALPAAAAAFGIAFDGRGYHYHQYSYDQLADALDYAKLDRVKPDFREEFAPHAWKQWFEPTAEDLQMATHGVGYERGRYYYGPYRYDMLAAALDYAKRQPGLSPAGPQVTKEIGEP